MHLLTCLRGCRFPTCAKRLTSPAPPHKYLGWSQFPEWIRQTESKLVVCQNGFQPKTNSPGTLEVSSTALVAHQMPFLSPGWPGRRELKNRDGKPKKLECSQATSKGVLPRHCNSGNMTCNRDSMRPLHLRHTWQHRNMMPRRKESVQ